MISFRKISAASKGKLIRAYLSESTALDGPAAPRCAACACAAGAAFWGLPDVEWSIGDLAWRWPDRPPVTAALDLNRTSQPVEKPFL